MSFDIASALLWVFPLLLAVVCHEWAHGYAAYRLGDNTAASMGRLTLNPIAHVDPMGTILIPGLLFITGAPFLFGYAKPVPVSWNRLRNPMRDMVYVAAAGPAMNLVLAAVSALLLGLLGPKAMAVLSGHGSASMTGPGGIDMITPVAIMCARSVMINVVLAVFNLLPIPPLDGGRVAVGLLPRQWAYTLARVEPYGFLIVVALLMSGGLSMLITPVIGAVLSLLDLFFI